MDFGATISRAFRIMWDYKVLWILGFLAALGGSKIKDSNAFIHDTSV